MLDQGGIPLRCRRVQVEIPRGDAETLINAVKDLAALGSVGGFDPGPDLSGLTGDSGVGLGRIQLAARLSWDESGLNLGGGSVEPATAPADATVESRFLADRPFLILLLDRDANTVHLIATVRQAAPEP
jgi:serine protease inhibitor